MDMEGVQAHENVIMETEDSQNTQETQPATQSTNGPSQTESIYDRLWGYLQPASASLHRTEFEKSKPKFTIGRNRDKNDIIFPGFKVSNEHCIITWNGNEGADSVVVVQDKSSNGTFINGEKVGKTKSKILNGGNEIAFGTCIPQTDNKGIEDYRFVFHHVAAGRPEGLDALYDISCELGRGSFATVRKAMCRSTGAWYAIKTITPSKLGRAPSNPASIDTREMNEDVIKREIKLMENLKHPNICQLKEVFVQSNHDYCLVLELIEGGDLLDYIVKYDGVTEPMAKHISRQICDALAYCHDMNVTHRDLKPENVLLTLDNPPNAKIADFGLSKMVDSMTMLRTMCGTPSYLAPEVVAQSNNQGYDQLVDSWSVGVIIYSMLSCANPFIEDETQKDVRLRIIHRTIDWTPLEQSNVTPEARDFVGGLLALDPALRTAMRPALEHEWFTGIKPESQSVPIGSGAQVPKDFTMLSVSEFTPSQGQIDQPMDATVPVSQDVNTNGVRRGQGSRAIQRRSKVLAQAAEGVPGVVVPEPDWELIEHFSQSEPSSSNAHASSSTPTPTTNAIPTNGKNGNNKRMRQDLTPLSELDENEGDVDGDAKMADIVSPRKKGRSSEESQNGTVASGGPRTRSRAKAPVSQDAEEEPTPRRRSTRPNAGKR